MATQSLVNHLAMFAMLAAAQLVYNWTWLNSNSCSGRKLGWGTLGVWFLTSFHHFWSCKKCKVNEFMKLHQRKQKKPELSSVLSGAA